MKNQKDLAIFLKDPRGWCEEATAAKLMGTVGHATTWVFHTEDCRKTYEELHARGVKFSSAPEVQPYGVEAVFEDLYGNVFSLLQPR
jgi:predicted enzyme related to lactoylglutathione lyase